MTPTVITSPHNPQLKELRRLQRRRERDRTQRFLAEGEDLVAPRTPPVAYRWPATG